MLDVVKTQGMNIMDCFQKDSSILVLYWEALFFSDKFRMQEMAETFLFEHPEVARNLDADHILSRASDVTDDRVFRQLIEICMRFDLDDYNKTRAFEGLLLHQCEAN